MTYAVVRDIPASWDRYALLGESFAEGAPLGLLVHVAGPTDEGFRVIDLWSSREDYERHQEAHPVDLATLGAPTLRELEVVTTVVGERP